MSTVRATVNCFVGHGGQSVQLLSGQEWPADDPVVLANRDYFTDPEPAGPDVEPAPKRARLHRAARKPAGGAGDD